MAVFKRGQVWWFKFRFQGQVIRESAKTNSKTLAREAERSRRRELETAVNRIPRRERSDTTTSKNLCSMHWTNSPIS
jgi:hypothetical protein